MVSLKVRVPSLEGIGDEEDARKREKRLKKVETVLQKLIGREARMWLITALASLEVPSQVQASCFLDLFSNSLRASRVSRGDEEEMQVGECFPEQSFSFELGQFLLQKEMTTCFFFAFFCEGDSFQQGNRSFAFSVSTACCWMLQDVLQLCICIFLVKSMQATSSEAAQLVSFSLKIRIQFFPSPQKKVLKISTIILWFRWG
jgi:hypothetical protein